MDLFIYLFIYFQSGPVQVLWSQQPWPPTRPDSGLPAIRSSSGGCWQAGGGWLEVRAEWEGGREEAGIPSAGAKWSLTSRPRGRPRGATDPFSISQWTTEPRQLTNKIPHSPLVSLPCLPPSVHTHTHSTVYLYRARWDMGEWCVGWAGIQGGRLAEVGGVSLWNWALDDELGTGESPLVWPRPPPSPLPLGPVGHKRALSWQRCDAYHLDPNHP